MDVTAVTTWFPTSKTPSRGSFVVRDALAIGKEASIRLVHLVPPVDDDASRRVRHEGIEVLRIPMNPRNPLSVARAAVELSRALEGSNVVHSMAFSALLPLALPPVARALAGRAWVHTEHWSALSSPRSLGPARLALPALTPLLSRPTLVTSVCEYLARPIRAARPAGEVRIVPCIVEPHALMPRRERADSTLRLVSTGGLIERKDPLVAVRTLAELNSRGIDAHLTWIGDGPLRGDTLDLAASLGIADKISLPGAASGAEVREALGGADLFFGPTRADNFFVSAAEALVAGRPAVVGATGGQGEYIDPEVGALVPRQDPREYAEAIIDVDRRTAQLSSEEIAATVGDHFSAARVGALYQEAYARALDLTKGSRP